MNKHPSTALALTVAVALTTGSLLVEHPSTTDQAPGAYSDITIAEADNHRAPISRSRRLGRRPPQKARRRPVLRLRRDSAHEANKGTARPNP
jgi:hypothetical protein